MRGADLDTSFLEYVLEQGFHLELVVLLVPALVYLGVAAGLGFAFRRRIEPGTLRATFQASLVVVLVAVTGITTFEAMASWYRPNGDGVMLGTPNFRDRVEIAFYTLYAAVVLLAPVVAWLVGRVRGRRPELVALAVTITIVGFLSATLPLVEFLNACHTGGPLLTDRYVDC